MQYLAILLLSNVFNAPPKLPEPAPQQPASSSSQSPATPATIPQLQDLLSHLQEFRQKCAYFLLGPFPEPKRAEAMRGFVEIIKERGVATVQQLATNAKLELTLGTIQAACDDREVRGLGKRLEEYPKAETALERAKKASTDAQEKFDTAEGELTQKKIERAGWEQEVRIATEEHEAAVVQETAAKKELDNITAVQKALVTQAQEELQEAKTGREVAKKKMNEADKLPFADDTADAEAFAALTAEQRKELTDKALAATREYEIAETQANDAYLTLDRVREQCTELVTQAKAELQEAKTGREVAKKKMNEAQAALNECDRKLQGLQSTYDKESRACQAAQAKLEDAQKALTALAQQDQEVNPQTLADTQAKYDAAKKILDEATAKVEEVLEHANRSRESNKFKVDTEYSYEEPRHGHGLCRCPFIYWLRQIYEYSSKKWDVHIGTNECTYLSHALAAIAGEEVEDILLTKHYKGALTPDYVKTVARELKTKLADFKGKYSLELHNLKTNLGTLQAPPDTTQSEFFTKKYPEFFLGMWKNCTDVIRGLANKISFKENAAQAAPEQTKPPMALHNPKAIQDKFLRRIDDLSQSLNGKTEAELCRAGSDCVFELITLVEDIVKQYRLTESFARTEEEVRGLHKILTRFKDQCYQLTASVSLASTVHQIVGDVHDLVHTINISGCTPFLMGRTNSCVPGGLLSPETLNTYEAIKQNWQSFQNLSAANNEICGLAFIEATTEFSFKKCISSDNPFDNQADFAADAIHAKAFVSPAPQTEEERKAYVEDLKKYLGELGPKFLNHCSTILGKLKDTDPQPIEPKDFYNVAMLIEQAWQAKHQPTQPPQPVQPAAPAQPKPDTTTEDAANAAKVKEILDILKTEICTYVAPWTVHVPSGDAPYTFEQIFRAEGIYYHYQTKGWVYRGDDQPTANKKILSMLGAPDPGADKRIIRVNHPNPLLSTEYYQAPLSGSSLPPITYRWILVTTTGVWVRCNTSDKCMTIVPKEKGEAIIRALRVQELMSKLETETQKVLGSDKIFFIPKEADDTAKLKYHIYQDKAWKYHHYTSQSWQPLSTDYAPTLDQNFLKLATPDPGENYRFIDGATNCYRWIELDSSTKTGVWAYGTYNPRQMTISAEVAENALAAIKVHKESGTLGLPKVGTPPTTYTQPGQVDQSGAASSSGGVSGRTSSEVAPALTALEQRNAENKKKVQKLMTPLLQAIAPNPLMLLEGAELYSYIGDKWIIVSPDLGSPDADAQTIQTLNARFLELVANDPDPKYSEPITLVEWPTGKVEYKWIELDSSTETGIWVQKNIYDQYRISKEISPKAKEELAKRQKQDSRPEPAPEPLPEPNGPRRTLELSGPGSQQEPNSWVNPLPGLFPGRSGQGDPSTAPGARQTQQNQNRRDDLQDAFRRVREQMAQGQGRSRVPDTTQSPPPPRTDTSSPPVTTYSPPTSSSAPASPPPASSGDPSADGSPSLGSSPDTTSTPGHEANASASTPDRTPQIVVFVLVVFAGGGAGLWWWWKHRRQ